MLVDHTQNILSIAKVDITNAKKTARAIITGRFGQIDPIVNDNSCQIRALRAMQLVSNRVLRNEAQSLYDHALKLERKLDAIINKPQREYTSLRQLLDFEGLNLQTSEGMEYLTLAHFLTIAKVYRVSSTGVETAYIDYSTLQSKLSKRVSIDFLKDKVAKAQSLIAQLSVGYIQAQAQRLSIRTSHDARFIESQLAEENVVDLVDNGLSKLCTCAYYNFKTILLRLREEYSLVLVKEYSRNNTTTGIFFRSKPQDMQTHHRHTGEVGFMYARPSAGDFERLTPEQVNALDVNEPVFVIEGFLPPHLALSEHITQIGLYNLCLLNVATVNQFSKKEITIDFMDEPAKREIAQTAQKALELGCNKEVPRAFTIVHTHASSVKAEKLNKLE